MQNDAIIILQFLRHFCTILGAFLCSRGSWDLFKILEHVGALGGLSLELALLLWNRRYGFQIKKLCRSISSIVDWFVSCVAVFTYSPPHDPNVELNKAGSS